jgi:hypothetical protein
VPSLARRLCSRRCTCLWEVQNDSEKQKEEIDACVRVMIGNGIAPSISRETSKAGLQGCRTGTHFRVLLGNLFFMSSPMLCATAIRLIDCTKQTKNRTSLPSWGEPQGPGRGITRGSLKTCRRANINTA